MLRISTSGAGRSLLKMAALGFVWGGVCFGFNGIKHVLLERGLFADECDDDGRLEPCSAQLGRVDFAFSFSSSMLNVAALFNGTLLARRAKSTFCWKIRAAF